jgi:hypothetical protein
MAFCASDAETAGIAESSLSRVSAVAFAQVVSAAAWPTRQPSAWITFSPKCRCANMCFRYTLLMRFGESRMALETTTCRVFAEVKPAAHSLEVLAARPLQLKCKTDRHENRL